MQDHRPQKDALCDKSNHLIPNPAGTLAPIIKLKQADALPSTPTIYANGDNLIDINFYESYLSGLLAGLKLGIDPNELVIDIVTLVPWEQSAAYGTVDLDFSTGLVRAFKSPV